MLCARILILVGSVLEFKGPTNKILAEANFEPASELFIFLPCHKRAGGFDHIPVFIWVACAPNCGKHSQMQLWDVKNCQCTKCHDGSPKFVVLLIFPRFRRHSMLTGQTEGIWFLTVMRELAKLLK